MTPDEVRTALREYLGSRPGVEVARRLRDGDAELVAAGFDIARWHELVRDVGVASLAASEERGGLGLGLGHVIAAVEEAGAVLLPGPLKATVLLAWLDAQLAPASRSLGQDLDRIMAGEGVAGLAGWVEPSDARPDLDLRDGAVTGTVNDVSHGATASTLVTIARSGGRTVPVVVHLDAEGVDITRTAQRTVDLTTPMGTLELDGVPATELRLPEGGDAAAWVQAAVWVLDAAEQVGGVQGCVRDATDYAKVRVQFDQPIGSYQAIQHRCADMVADLASARAMVTVAATYVEQRDSRAEACAALARAEASDAFNRAADALIQIHGGIGFTWEHDAHLYFRRARATGAASGSAARLRSYAVRRGATSLLVDAVQA